MSGTTSSRTRNTKKGKSRQQGGRANEAQHGKEINLKAPEPVRESSVQERTPTAAPPSEDIDERDAVCWICAEPVKYYSVSECNHRTCHVCALRLRALYKRKDCTFCKHDQATLIFTLSEDKDFESFSPEAIPFKDSKLSISFETQEMMEESLILLRFNCPDSSCDFIAHGWGDLKIHARATHGKSMCDVCIRYKKVFTHEHILYPPSQLPLHLPSISHRSISRNQTQNTVEGGVHPMCEFCRECYFGDDELFAHMRERHEECFLCKRDGIRDQYFNDYNSLEQHFNLSHHPCKEPQCQAQKFVVFGSALDLKAHLVEEHGKDMTTRDRRDARRLEGAFEFADRSNGGPGRENRNRPRAREQESPRNTSTQSARRDAFGANLTTTAAPVAPAEPQDRQQNLPVADSRTDPEIAERHAAFLARLDALTPNAANAVPAVRAAIRSYRASESGPRDVISTLFEVVDRDLDTTARLISLLVELLDDEDKRRALLSAWNGFKLVQRRDFPELTPVAPGAEYAGVAGGRILNAKSSASVRSSSSQSQRQVWDRVAQAAASTSTQLPPVVRRQGRFPSIAAGRNIPPFRKPARTTAWSGAGASAAPSPEPSAITQSSTAQTSNSSSKRSTPINMSTSQFPSLPSASSSRARPQVSGNQSMKNILGEGPKAANPWAQNHGEDSIAVSEDAQPESNPSKGKKKKGKEKQTLFTFGTFPT